ncbi:MAG: hypothetical protein ACJ73D_08050 [Pyrinomonadaceae bacterium]
MIKIILLALVLLNTLGLLVCDDPTNQNSAASTASNASMNATVANANMGVNGANGNLASSNSTAANAAPPTGVNAPASANSAGTLPTSVTGGNTAGPDAGNMAPAGTPR